MTYGIPGPKGHWLVGSLGDFQRDKLGFLQRCAQDYGDLFQFRVGPLRIIVVNDLVEIQKILIDDADLYQKSRVTRDVFGRIVGNGLLVSEGEFHRRQRRLSQPAFDAKRLRSYAKIVVKHAEAAVVRWAQLGEVDVEAEMSRITLAVVAEALFGAEVARDGEGVSVAMADVQQAASSLFDSAFVPPSWVPTRANRVLKAAVGELDRVLDRIIAARRTLAEERDDLLSMLLQARDEDGEAMSAQQLRDEAITLFLAGFETTANALTWTWYYLAKNPDARAKLEREVSAGTFEDGQSGPYATMVFKESLRMCCPIWAFNRSPTKQHAISGHAIGPKDVILISPFLLHQKAQYFPVPEQFDAERFSVEREVAIPRLAFLPFGAGPRICIGARMAMVEGSSIIATLSRRFRLHPTFDGEVERSVNISIRPKNGLRMRLEPLVGR